VGSGEPVMGGSGEGHGPACVSDRALWLAAVDRKDSVTMRMRTMSPLRNCCIFVSIHNS
jgi:hypothetical protein